MCPCVTKNASLHCSGNEPDKCGSKQNISLSSRPALPTFLPWKAAAKRYQAFILDEYPWNKQPSDCTQWHLTLIMEKCGDRGHPYKESLANRCNHPQNICPCHHPLFLSSIPRWNTLRAWIFSLWILLSPAIFCFWRFWLMIIPFKNRPFLACLSCPNASSTFSRLESFIFFFNVNWRLAGQPSLPIESFSFVLDHDYVWWWIKFVSVLDNQ